MTEGQLTAWNIEEGAEIDPGVEIAEIKTTKVTNAFEPTVLGLVRRLVDVETVKRSDQFTGVVVLPKRWIAERTFAWLNRHRFAKEWECLNAKGLAFIKLASMRFMIKRL